MSPQARPRPRVSSESPRLAAFFPMRYAGRVARALIASQLLASLGCGERAARSSDGTKRMADTLAKLYARATAQPDRYEFMNRQRVDALQASFFQQAGGVALRDRFEFARQLLLAGQTREAIAEMESMRRTMQLSPDARSPQFKPFFDLLGIAYLRLGEQDNCNLNPNTSVCILGRLHHTQQEGARTAIAVYSRILQAFPNDVGSRWLLNIAYMAVGEYPSQVPKEYLIPNL